MNRVLITRPRHGSVLLLIKELRSMGWQPVHLPLLRHIECEDRPLPSVWDYDLLLCVSPYAAKYFVRSLKRTQQDRKTVPLLLTVGEQTASYLRNYGFDTDFPSIGVGSEALLSMGILQRVRDKKILLLCGEEGRELLESVLRERGAIVTKHFLYRCESLHYTRCVWEKTAPLRLLWVTSGRILSVLVESTRMHRLNWIYDSLLVLGSQRLIRVTEGMPFKRKICLGAPDNDTFMEYIANMDEDLWQRRK